MTSADLSEKIGVPIVVVEKIRMTVAQFPMVEKVVLYGSRAKGGFRPGSDIDLTFFGAALKLHTLYRIDEALDDLLTPYLFDLSLFSQIDNPDLIDHIQRVGIVIYEQEAPRSAVVV